MPMPKTSRDCRFTSKLHYLAQEAKNNTLQYPYNSLNKPQSLRFYVLLLHVMLAAHAAGIKLLINCNLPELSTAYLFRCLTNEIVNADQYYTRMIIKKCLQQISRRLCSLPLQIANHKLWRDTRAVSAGGLCSNVDFGYLVQLQD